MDGSPYVDMELDDDSVLDNMAFAPKLDQRGPQYPYGLRLCLDEQTLNRLGFHHADFMVGGVLHLHAFARVTSVSEDSPRVEIQITDLRVEDEDAEDDDEAAPQRG